MLIIPLLSYAQESTLPNPDTLLLEIKPSQKIILIGTNLKAFERVKIDSLVRNALNQVQDSLGEAVSKPVNSQPITYPENKFRNRFLFETQIGAAHIRNTLVPTLDFLIEYAPKKHKYYFKREPYYSFFTLGLQQLYFYERDINRRFKSFVDPFLTWSVGNRYNTDLKPEYKLKLFGVGGAIFPHWTNAPGKYYPIHQTKIFFFAQPTNSPFIIRTELYYDGLYKNVMPSIAITSPILRFRKFLF